MYAVKATGIVRRIDNLGRIVIPKELRKTMQIQVGDPVEIFTDDHDEIILKKYFMISELSSYAENFADTVHKNLAQNCLVTDTHKVIAASGANAKSYVDKRLHRDYTEFLFLCRSYRYNDDSEKMKIIQDEEGLYCQAAVPIISPHGNMLLGSILLVQPEISANIRDDDFRTLVICSQLFAKLIG